MIDRFRALVPFRRKEISQEEENLPKMMVRKTIDLAKEYGEWNITEHYDVPKFIEEDCLIFSINGEYRFRGSVRQTWWESGNFEHESELIVTVGDFGHFGKTAGIIRATFSSKDGDSFRAIRRDPNSFIYERRLSRRAWQTIIKSYLNSHHDEEVAHNFPSRGVVHEGS